MPDLKEEKKLLKKGFKRVAGLDEAGRGPLAGPVVAAAVLIDLRLQSTHRLLPRQTQAPKISDLRLLKEIKDSKKLASKKREEFYSLIIKNPKIKWGIGRVSERVIDKINILEATKLAMKRAVKNVKTTTHPPHPPAKRAPKPDFLILDGKMKLDLPIPQKSIVKADEKVFSCSVASIIAKVTRDRIMKRYHRKYPKYGFNKHKGYPTKYHIKMLKKYGPCKIHRKSFQPVKTCPSKISKKLRRACKLG